MYFNFVIYDENKWPKITNIYSKASFYEIKISTLYRTLQIVYFSTSVYRISCYHLHMFLPKKKISLN